MFLTLAPLLCLQPALLYIVPAVIGFLATHCIWNGDVKPVCSCNPLFMICVDYAITSMQRYSVNNFIQAQTGVFVLVGILRSPFFFNEKLLKAIICLKLLRAIANERAVFFQRLAIF